MPFALGVLTEELLVELQEMPQHPALRLEPERRVFRDPRPQVITYKVAAHAPGWVEFATQGVDILMTQSVACEAPGVTAGVETSSIGAGGLVDCVGGDGASIFSCGAPDLAGCGVGARIAAGGGSVDSISFHDAWRLHVGIMQASTSWWRISRPCPWRISCSTPRRRIGSFVGQHLRPDEVRQGAPGRGALDQRQSG